MNHRTRFLMRRRILQTALTAGGLAAAGPERSPAGMK